MINHSFVFGNVSARGLAPIGTWTHAITVMTNFAPRISGGQVLQLIGRRMPYDDIDLNTLTSVKSYGHNEEVNCTGNAQDINH